MTLKLIDLAGYDLGEHAVRYEARDAIIYALAVGAPSDRLDLVYERDLRVLPTFACALGLWAVEAAGDLGAYDRKRSLHVTQSLAMHGRLPRQGGFPTRGRVDSVWDKGKATLVDISVTSEFFTATYTIFLPGIGGFGGPAAAAARAALTEAECRVAQTATSPHLAALYRLTGDYHPIHIDPEVSRANGFDRPILHGLCTFGIAARSIAELFGAHPADLRQIEAKMSAPVMPGDTVTTRGRKDGTTILFEAAVGDRTALKDGSAVF